MMTIEMVETGFSLFISICILFWALKAWRLTSATCSRQEIFAARADLFDAAYEKKAFNDPAYREKESEMNGLLRWLDEVNGVSVALILLLHKRLIPSTSRIGNITSSLLEKELSTVDNRIRRTLKWHLWTGSFSGFLFMSLLWFASIVKTKTTKYLYLFMNILISYSREMAGDDFARKEMRRWKNNPNAA